MNWKLLLAGLAALLGLSACGPKPPAAGAPAAEEPVLNIYNWSDYIGPNTIADFEQATGIKVRYDVFDSNETLLAKMMAGRTGYDIIVPSAQWAKLMFDGGLLRKLDKSALPNLKYLDPGVEGALAQLDPGNQYVVDWLWGYTTVGINVDKLKAALGDLPLPANAWDLIFKPEYILRAKRCGVSLLDSAGDVIPAALRYLGRPPFSQDPADYASAAALLKSIRPAIGRFDSSGYINDLANGSLCLVMGFAGDINIARRRAIEGGTGARIEALVPDTGALLFFDVMAIPADAPHPRNALRWINYILQPKVDAELTNKVFYANPNAAALPYINPAVAKDPTIFLSHQDLARMVPNEPITPDLRRLSTRTFTAFKTGY
ncbi:MAG: extracellular solute-binding protein [Burkholderiales bacterium]|nr:extracellular solute-binding protein [Burkholderiales bacterium]MDE1926372.1 extracellular solute-binding protein [Burkholderiales bacterium]MDE2502197.1 extracellular solute-binding protein [Burkholderiales bacterium]